LILKAWHVASVLGLCLAMAGCATIEYSQTPEVPEIRMKPDADSADATSPPPLKKEEGAPPAEQQPATSESGPPLRLTVEAAIAMALENNQALQVEEINPALARTFVAEERAVFDPTLAGAFTRTRNRLERELLVDTPLRVPDGAGGLQTVGTVINRVDTADTDKETAATIGLDEFLPTGTSIGVNVRPSEASSRQDSSNPSVVGEGNETDSDATTVDLTVTQRLLRGAGLGVNLASLRQAHLGYLSSGYALRGFAESLVAQVENTYWDYLLAERQIEIFEESLELAENQAAEVEARIEVGQVAESERAAADAEVALRRSLLIDARSNLAQVRLALLRLLNPSTDALRSTELELVSEPIMPEIRLDEVEDAVAFARRMRPDLNQARLLIQQDDLALVRTRNGLLPQLDLFATFSKRVTETEYAKSFEGSTRSLEDDTVQTEVGIQFSYPLGNRAARARHQRAQFARDQDLEALANLSQLVEQDVRGAYIELNRAREQVAATAATRRLQELTAQTEQEKFRVGKSTTILVAQAQRDLLAAQIDEVQAATAFLQAIVNLYFLDGSLLLRRGVDAPGAEPVILEEPAF
jgi:outer membrane protein